MHLTPHEEERLLLAAGADLARRRLARGAALSVVEAVSLICDEVQEMAWDGLPLADVIDRATKLIPTESMTPGAASLVPHLQVEALFPHGTVLVYVPEPFGAPHPDGPGGVRPLDGRIELAPGRARRVTTAQNTGTRHIWISSHVPLAHVNRAIVFDLDDPGNYRLDIPAGAACKVEPGAQVRLCVVEIIRGER